MMSFLAASLAIGAAQSQAPDLLWSRLKRSVAIIQRNGEPAAVGALVDSRGWFITQLSGPAPVVIPAMIDENVINLHLVSVDQETNLALFAARPWKSQDGTPVRVARGSSLKGESLLAVLPGGTARAELNGRVVVGQLQNSLRYAPLSEILLETRPQSLAGAITFNAKAEIAGILAAALPSPSQYSEQPRVPTGQSRALNYLPQNQSQIGPGNLVLGYSLGTTLLDRVVQGFLSPGHKVQHPSIGIFFRGVQEGVMIDTVMPNSSAELAGVRTGDFVLEADGKRINRAVDLAVFLFDQRLGATITLKLRRGQNQFEVKVQVKGQAASEARY